MAETKEHQRARQAAWERAARAENPEKFRARSRAYYATHRDEVLAQHAASRAADPDRARAVERDRRARSRGLASHAERTGTCEICGETVKRYWDHDHETGEHRGWLCRNCNVAIGMMKNDPMIACAAAEYLSRNLLKVAV